MTPGTDQTLTWATPLAEQPPDGFSLLIQDGRGLHLTALFPNRSVVLGRDPSSDVVVDAEGLSRRHASFRAVEGAVEVTDLGSRNGTFLAGQRLTTQQVTVGAEVTLGSAVVVIVRGTALSGADLLSYDSLRNRLGNLSARHARANEAVGIFHLRLTAGLSATQWVSWLRERVGAGGAICLYAPTIVELMTPPLGLDALASLARALVVERPGVMGGWVSWPAAGSNADALLSLAKDAAGLARTAGQLVTFEELKAAKTPSTRLPMVAQSAQMRALLKEVEQIARSQVPVLVLGESGTGKELIARELHLGSPREKAPFKPVNCAALPPTLLESLLFGHEKGAFTGADRVSRGLFEEAEGGTVFLDEVGELPPAAQAALLRVVEARTIMRVGSTQERPVDVRLVAATHRDLDAMAREGAFREDLLFRLNAFTLRLAPLRDRIDDLPMLVERFLAEACAQHDGVPRRLTTEAMDVLLRHQWLVLSTGHDIGPDALGPRLTAAQPQRAVPGSSSESDHKERLADYERAMLLDVLEKSDWNQSAAARKLGLPRRTLVYKIKHLGLRRRPEGAVRAGSSEGKNRS